LLLTTSHAVCQQVRDQKDSVAKQLNPIEGKAIVYIIRPAILGLIIKMDVECNSSFIGSTLPGEYIYTILEPGMHHFESKAENRAKLEINLEGGKIYYLKQQVSPGVLTFRSKLKLMTEKKGKDELSLCRISKRNVFTN
jgi:hypothetical protein